MKINRKKIIGVATLAIALIMNLQYALFSYADGKVNFSTPTYAQTDDTSGDPSDTNSTDLEAKYFKAVTKICSKDCSYYIGKQYYFALASGFRGDCDKTKEFATCTKDDIYACTATCSR